MIGEMEFWVPGHPAGYSRSSVQWKQLPEANKVWRQAVLACYLEAALLSKITVFPRQGEHTGPVAVVLIFHGSKADLTNLAKEVEDALNGVAYKDDRQVGPISIWRGNGQGADEPGCMVKLTYTEPEREVLQPRKSRKKVAL